MAVDRARESAAGLSFALTDEQKALRELAHEFAEKEIRPKAAEYDEHPTHPADVIAKAHEVGLMNLARPEELGGAGLCAASRARSSARSSAGAAPGSARRSRATASARGRSCSPAATSRSASGCRRCSRSRSSARSGSPSPTPAPTSPRIKTTAVRKGDEYVLNGSKTFITNAGHAAWIGRLREDRPGGGAPRHLGVHRPDGHPRRHRSRSTSTRWASARPTRRRSRSRTSSCPPRTGSARRATASRSRCRRSTSRGPGTAIGARRRRAGGVRARRRVREGARHVRPADRDEPGRQLPDRRHGDEDRGRAAALLAGGVDARPGLRAQGDALLVVSRSASPPTRR